MNESKKADMFRIIAAVCFLLSTIFEIKYVCYSFGMGANMINIVRCIATLSIFLLFILNLNEKIIGYEKIIGCLIASGICAVAHFIRAIYYFINWVNFLLFLAYASFCFFLLINILPSLSKMKSKMLIFVFVSVGLFLIAHFVYVYHNVIVARGIREIPSYFYPSYIKKVLASCKDDVISDLFISLGIVFTGSWFWKYRNNPKLLSKKAVSAQSNLYGGAEKLETLKELLDSGAITQEEFDEKKKQILNF